MENSLLGLSSTDVRRLAYDYATKLGLRNTFNRECQMVGKDWFISFLKRNPNLSVRKAEGMNMARLCVFNRQQVDRFFSVYKDLIDRVISAKSGNKSNTECSSIHPTYIFSA